MALTGVIQRRDNKSVITQNPPRVGEIVYALDTEEYGSLQNGTLIWKKFDDIVKSVSGKIGNVTLNKSDVGLDRVNNTNDLEKPINTATQEALNNHSMLINPHGVTAELLGLGNVDNTSDMNKPVSIATQEAIDNGISSITDVENALKLGGIDADKYALIENYFNKTETQDLLNQKADIGVSYTKDETDSLIDEKASAHDLMLTDQKVQTLEISNAGKADKTYVDDQDDALQSNIDLKADQTDLNTLNATVSDNITNINSNSTKINTNIDDINSLKLGKADKTYVDSQDANIQDQVNTNTNDIANLTSGGTTKSYVDDQDDALGVRIDNLDSKKADKTYVDNQDNTLQTNIDNLDSKKADKTYVDSEIDAIDTVSQDYVDTKVDALQNSKADKTYVDDQDNTLQTNIDLKADKTYVDDQDNTLQSNINNKADKTYVDDNVLNLQSDIDNLDTKKADKTYVDNQDNTLQTNIDLKADKTYVDSEIDDLTDNVDELYDTKADITYVDSAISGLDAKEAVLVATDSNITLNGLQTIDGIELSENDRILVKNQTNAAENGIYSVKSDDWIRTEDADNNPGSEVNNGMYCFVTNGTNNANTGWILSATDPVELGTTELYFNIFSNVIINANDILTKLKTVDGSGSGLDADLLDGHDTVYFAPQSDTYTKSEVDDRVADATMSDDGILDAVKRVDGSGSGIDADLLDGHDSSYFVAKSGGTMSGDITFVEDQQGIVWTRNTDGASIKFYNTADDDTNSRLEFSVRDNGDEFFRWVNDGVEKMTLKGDLLEVPNATISGDLKAGTITETSARKFKKNITPIVNAMDIINKMTGVQYQWKKDSSNDIGFIADDVEKVLPELISYDNEGEIQGMNYSKITAVLVNALKEQQKQIDELKKLIK